ncbi:major capsid protein [Rhodococcus pyridinivorans]|uniref:phage major capsid protein n=1 Tax=Rhodococcus pyridinivorans TaxID=103816 RepID=UPI0002E1B30E|nr:phage major capsid protein [Rhodococcus pyridinivorans]AWZ23805.1 major capsid protein [Rhodococcus pyridinivorans]
MTFNPESLHGLNREQRLAKRAEFVEQAQALLADSNDGTIDADAFETIERGVKFIDEVNEREARLRELAQNSTHVERTTPDNPKPVTQRDAALRIVERSLKDHEDAQATCERVIGSGEGIGAQWVRVAGDPVYSDAFAKLVADPRGLDLTDRERAAVAAARQLSRAMSTGANTGGELVPVHLDPAVMITNGGNVNPLRAISRVEQLAVGGVWRGVSSEGVTAEWLPEAAEAADASPDLGQPEVPVHKGTAFVPYSFELEHDGVDVLHNLQPLLVDAANNLTATAYTTGSGNGRPTGIVTALAAAVPSVVISGTGEALTADQLVALQNALPPRWSALAQWAAGLPTWNSARGFETVNGAVRFPEMAAGQLLGRPFHELSNMDSTIDPSTTGDNFVAIYGDFKQFLIVDRIGTTVELIPNLLGPNQRPTGQRGMLLYFRTGSDVLVPNAFRMLNIPTTT